MAWSIVVYCMEKSRLGIRLMLGTVEACGEGKSMMSLFFPEYFLVAMPIGLILNVGKGGVGKGPIMKASLTSVSRNLSTVPDSKMVDCRL